MGWSTSAPSGITWSSWVTGKEASHVNNYYNYWIKSRVGRGANNTIAVQVELWVYGYNYDVRTQYPNVGIELKAEVAIGSGSYAASSAYTCAGNYVTSTKSKTLYYTGTANSGVSIKARSTWNSNASGVTTQTAPAYTTKYTIAYNANGGTGAPASQTKTYATNLTLSTTKPTRTGYTFLRWNTKADGTGTNYNPGATYSANSAATLYAQWQLITYTVTFNGNGNTGGSTSDQTKNYGQALTISQNGFTRTNYTFLYWNTAANGSGTTYKAGASYTANAALTLYAIWKKNNIPVYININNTVVQVEKAYMNVNNEIKECTVYLNVDNVIKTLV